ncbi:NTP transferase domain-containing protein [Arthrobacter sp. ISL-30]|uniref:molybdenum cofactor guanylyltransferase n=1 Tax=Arthrobacter sp. ISL-30 TaxID=2819109 RepID=UPI0027DF96D8|nr:NTP transferase domain-containing protein [Arthrobacter sp. ISL-30]
MGTNALVEFDALILAGGQSTRLGGVPKSGLIYDGGTLLEHTLQAASEARAVVVVGPDPGNLPKGTMIVREEPPFAGPAAAIAAGLAALRSTQSSSRTAAEWTLILACDMPHIGEAVPILLRALEARTLEGASLGDGVVASSADGRLQPLAGIYRTAALSREASAAADRDELRNGPVFRLLARLELLPVNVPAHSTDDVDTWDDAAALGVRNDLPGAKSGANESLHE